jgi:putative component of membrane protein insertase Oxa1/YidC/SpoIIIJ protein YidD
MSANNRMVSTKKSWFTILFLFFSLLTTAQTEFQLMTQESVDQALTDSLSIRNSKLKAAVESFVFGSRDSAAWYFRSALDPLDTNRMLTLDSLFLTAPVRGWPSPVLAGAMSAILPGLGQAYAGQPLDGLNSFGLIAGMTGTTLLAPGLIYLTSPLTGRCYLSGINHAVEQANSVRYVRQNAFLQTVLALYDSVPASLLAGIEVKRPVKINYFQHVPKQGWSERGLGLALAGYKQFISSQDGDVCVFEPSCSVYMVDAIRQEGLIVGYLDGIDRLMRCRPFMSFSTHDPLVTTQLTTSLSDKKPWLAAFYSGLVPGLGKVYTGEWKDGVYAFALVSAFSWLTYRFAEDKGLSPYTILYGSLAMSFYVGNVYGSWKSAVRHR